MSNLVCEIRQFFVIFNKEQTEVYNNRFLYSVEEKYRIILKGSTRCVIIGWKNNIG